MFLEKLSKKLNSKKFTTLAVNENGTLVLTNEEGQKLSSRCYIISSSTGKAVLLNSKEVSGTTFVTGTPFAVLSEEKLYLNDNEWFSFKKLKEPGAHFVALVLHKEGMVFSYYCNNMTKLLTYHVEGFDSVQELMVTTINLVSLYDKELAGKLQTALFGSGKEDDHYEQKEKEI